MSHVENWMSHVECMNESCRKYERVMSPWCAREALRHVANINESCHLEWGMWNTWMSHVTLMCSKSSCSAHFSFFASNCVTSSLSLSHSLAFPAVCPPSTISPCPPFESSPTPGAAVPSSPPPPLPSLITPQTVALPASPDTNMY